MRNLLNVSRDRQHQLHAIYPWLHSVHANEGGQFKILSVSVFDHWLTREEASALLENVPLKEQLRRNKRHADFCARIVRETEVLSFAFRRMQRDRLVFRKFTSTASLSAYCTPSGGKTLKHRHFHVALPELRCVFYESWDDTHHFFSAEPAQPHRIAEWARESGLHVLQTDRPAGIGAPDWKPASAGSSCELLTP